MYEAVGSYDVRKFNADASLLGENRCKKNDILRIYHVFSGHFVGIG